MGNYGCGKIGPGCCVGPSMAETYRCPKCTEHTDDWYVSPGGKRASYCRGCTNDYARMQRSTNGDTVSDEGTGTDEWSVLKRAKVLELDLLEVLTKYRMWEGTCEACGIAEAQLDRSICVDHDHATGTFRGFLCHRCNLTLGHAKDSSTRLYALAQYIVRTTDTPSHDVPLDDAPS